MPYIDKEYREMLGESLYDLDRVLAELGDNPGHYNYVFSCLLWRMFKRTRRYGTINTIMGILSCVGQEFYIRFARGYEDTALAKNGDIDEYWWKKDELGDPKLVNTVPEFPSEEEYPEIAQSVGMDWFKSGGNDEDPGGQGC